MRPKYSYVYLLFFIIAGCTSRQGGLVYFNDCEYIKGWQSVQLARWPVHSGWFSNKIDSLHPYGLKFSLSFKDISSKQLQKVKISLWAFFTEKSKAALVMEIKDKSDSGLNWTGTPMENQIKEIGIWQKITTEISLKNSSLNKPDNIISIYPWDSGKKDVYIDDVEIEFIPELPR